MGLWLWDRVTLGADAPDQEALLERAVLGWCSTSALATLSVRCPFESHAEVLRGARRRVGWRCMYFWCLDNVHSCEQAFWVRNKGFRKISDVLSEQSRLSEGVLWFPQLPPPLKVYVK